MNVEDYIDSCRQAHRKMLAVLLDPEKLVEASAICQIGSLIDRCAPDFVFIGGSTYFDTTEPLIRALRPIVKHVPLVLFPGHPSQFTPEADALLFLSLLSGTNPDTLIGQQVASARRIRESGIETLSMGYILVDGGNESAAARATHTVALPVNDPDRIVDTAIAAELLGLHLIYLEAGSGAAHPASAALIQAVRQAVQVPIIVGGGIRCQEDALSAWEAGADIVVVGNYLEEYPTHLPLFTEARDNYLG